MKYILISLLLIKFYLAVIMIYAIKGYYLKKLQLRKEGKI